MNTKNAGFLVICILILGIAIYGLYITLNKNNSTNAENNVKEDILTENYIKITEIELGSFSTTIYDTDENRIKNIKNGCELLNNITLGAKQTFSFNETIGPYTSDRGFVESTGFDENGKLIDMMGGGICQVSSTLYNLALNLHFDIIERHQHSNDVGYIALGKDATIAYGELDLKFTNTTSYPITFKATCENNIVTITATTKDKLPQS